MFVESRQQLVWLARQLLGAGAGCVDADDVVHNAYLKVHKYLVDGNMVTDPYRFLCKTVRNLVLDNHRRTKIRRTEGMLESADVMPGADLSPVEHAVLSNIEIERLCKAVTSLPSQMRRVFVLNIVYEFSFVEIAERMGTTAQTTRKQGAEALKRVRAALAEQEETADVGRQSRRTVRFAKLAVVNEHD